ncbi:hypothetical protein FS800_26515 [Agrobacterium vitis]|uniref:hypothetical protein n=1 Tax=Allorhizobium ampelinum TaxID=3025782 RepID=UPI001F43BA5D|nr:hypothetical protein [Allorhizobium ampelinum]MCF1485643.1 hypothetical protein [Allorhizobium ampelinum]
MDERISQIKSALLELGKAVEDAGASHGNKTQMELWGWNFPLLNAQQLGFVSKSLGDKISKIPGEKLKKEFNPQFILIRIESFKASTLPYLWNGNGASAAPQYFSLLQWIDSIFEPAYEVAVNWEKLSADGMLPKQIGTKLRTYNTQLNAFSVQFQTLGDKIKYINEAHDAANQLPADLETLKSANEDIAEARAGVEKNRILSEAAHEEILKLLQLIRENETEAQQLVKNTEDAYSAATTLGLGQAFKLRANRLDMSMWAWVAGLVAALSLGAVIGHYRVYALQDLLIKNASSGAVTLSTVLAVISVAAPVWFAWIATKQIGHRFRLSEDYAFKASVAQAYEGYRREATRLDPSFAKRLFQSTLDRFEEAPIRFVEHETFGSPWHEFIKGGKERRSEKLAGTTTPETPVKNANFEGQ